MSVFGLLITAAGLSMDAFAVAICKGLEMRRLRYWRALLIAGAFGVFQALMPLIGWLMGQRLEALVKPFDHWIAFFLLSVIGAKMIWESCGKSEPTVEKKSELSAGELLILALATSIDALAVGIAFAAIGIEGAQMGASVSLIGSITFFLSLVGVIVGHVFGSRLKGSAELVGGASLIIIGVKILVEHLFWG